MTPDDAAAQAPGSYGDYAPAHGSGNGYLPAPPVPADTRLPGNAQNGYWQQPTAASGYTGDLPQPADPIGPTAAYGNGYGATGGSGYRPDGYPAGPADPAAYPPQDPYRRDEGIQYPGYSAGD